MDIGTRFNQMKKNNYFPLWLLVFLFSGNILLAQRKNTPSVSTGKQTTTGGKQASARKSTKKEVVDEEHYHSILSFGLTTNTNSGLLGGLAARKEIIINSDALHPQFHYIGLEFVNVNAYHENSISPNGSSFVYGKKNYLLALRPQYGREFNLFKKSSDGGVNINGILAAGPSIGILKPYYIEYALSSRSTSSVAYDPSIHDKGRIIGTGSFFSGFGQSKFVPGVHVKAGLNFELDSYRKGNISVEVGFLADIYSKPVDMFAFGDNQQTFTSGYLTIFFGGKK